MTAAPEPQASRRARFRDVYDANYHAFSATRFEGRQRARTPRTLLPRPSSRPGAGWTRFPRGEAARPWLYGVARNALANQRRSERRRGRLWGRLQAEPAPAARHGTTADDELASLAAAFARLKDDDRELLGLAAWEELDTGEIATVLGVRNAARIRLHRARRRLAHELQRTDASTARWSLVSGDAKQRLRREAR